LNTEELGVARPSRNYSKSGDLVVVNGLTAYAIFHLMWVAGTGYLIRVLASQYPDAEEPS
jgi:hypothetical protein